MLESYRKRGNEYFSRRAQWRPTEFSEIIESIAANCAGPGPTDNLATWRRIGSVANNPVAVAVEHVACLIDRNSVEFAKGIINGDPYAGAGI